MVARGPLVLDGLCTWERDAVMVSSDWVDYRDVIAEYKARGDGRVNWSDWYAMQCCAVSEKLPYTGEWRSLMRSVNAVMHTDYPDIMHCEDGHPRERTVREFIVLCCVLFEHGYYGDSTMTHVVLTMFRVFGFSVYRMLDELMSMGSAELDRFHDELMGNSASKLVDVAALFNARREYRAINADNGAINEIGAGVYSILEKKMGLDLYRVRTDLPPEGSRPYREQKKYPVMNSYILTDDIIRAIMTVGVEPFQGLWNAYKGIAGKKTGADRRTVYNAMITVAGRMNVGQIERLTKIFKALDGSRQGLDGSMVSIEWFDDTLPIPTTVLLEDVLSGVYDDNAKLPTMMVELLEASYRTYEYIAEHHDHAGDDYFGKHPSLRDDVAQAIDNPDDFVNETGKYPYYRMHSTQATRGTTENERRQGYSYLRTASNVNDCKQELVNEASARNAEAQLVYNAMMNLRHVSLAYPVWFLSSLYDASMQTVETDSKQASKQVLERATDLLTWLNNLDDATFARLMSIQVLPYSSQSLSRPFPDYRRFDHYGPMHALHAPVAHGEHTTLFYGLVEYTIRNCQPSSPFHRDLQGMIQELEPIMHAMHTSVDTVDNADTVDMRTSVDNDNTVHTVDMRTGASSGDSASSGEPLWSVILDRLAAWYDAARVVCPYWGRLPFLNAAQLDDGGVGLVHTMYRNVDDDLSYLYDRASKRAHSIIMYRNGSINPDYKYVTWSISPLNNRVPVEERNWLLNGKPPVSITLSRIHLWVKGKNDIQFPAGRRIRVQLFPDADMIPDEYYDAMRTTREAYKEWMDGTKIRERFYGALGAAPHGDA